MSNGPLPPLADADVADVYRRAGFSGGALVLMTAIGLGESGGDPDILGDEGLVTSKWGPSIGLSQIRSLWADQGTGRARDPAQLTDPDFNARAAWEISSQGSNFAPWSVFTSGAYRTYLDRAWAAVKGIDAPGRPPELSGLAGVNLPGIPGGGIAEKFVEPLVSGLSRVALVTVLLLGGAVLVVAGGWRASSGFRSRALAKAEAIPDPRVQAVAAAAKPKDTP